MKHFSQLIRTLESTNKTIAKTDALVAFFREASDEDKVWTIALFTGKRPKRAVQTKFLKEWVRELTGLPEWLFIKSYAAVGDLGETISLLLPPGAGSSDRPLSEWMNEIIELKSKTDAEKKDYVLEKWSQLNTDERLIFNKLIGGSFRIGVSSRTLINALAKFTGEEPSALTHKVMGSWDPQNISYQDLIVAENISADSSKPYPFCLAYPLDKEPQELGNRKDWIAEYKWDGIRGQCIRRNEEVFIWSRGEELVTTQFPEIETAVQEMSGSFVLDGEILAMSDTGIQGFNTLQKRINRKTVSKRLREEVPVGMLVSDILEYEGEDLRNKPLFERKALLNKLLENSSSALALSQEIQADSWDSLRKLREEAREKSSEGLMLKQKNSVYHIGRKKGDWWKWKVDPLSFDAVLIYAQKGSGRRSSKYTDYTFAVRDGDSLVTIAKAYSGLTDKEITEISRFVKKNAIEKFGPVRTVKPELVFEIAFEGIGYSSRHKSGVAVRFPRIVRWRRDKTVADIDELSEIKKLISD